MRAALFVMAFGVLIFVARRWIARAKAESGRRFDRAWDEEGLAWWYGFMGVVIVAFGLVVAGLALFGPYSG